MKKCRWCLKIVWPWQRNSRVGKVLGYSAHVGCHIKLKGNR